ncbi:MAG: proline dehydrogenase [Chloroflexi bacterium]|nr:proline dehydrogenase [Chloroflexota bacterium]
MLRRFLLYLSAAGWSRGIVTQMGLARRVARRFIAGETIDEAIAAVKALNAQGLLVTLDYLGESVHQAEDTLNVVRTYHAILDRIQAGGLQAGISLKLTHLGLDITEELCIHNLRAIAEDAQARGIPVAIDMENSPYVDRTLHIYRMMRDKYTLTNVGTVVQACLYRSKDDMRHLASEGASIRLVKGAYLEPETVAFPEKAKVDAQYAEIVRDYLQAPPPAYLQIATHDETLLKAAEQVVQEYHLTPDRYEYQMLYGIRTARQLELAQAGYQVRIYVPFGEAWYPYFMRRLAERPANLWFFVRSIFRA